MRTLELKPNTRYRIKIGNDLQASWCYGKVGGKTVHSEFTTSYFFERVEANPKTTRRNYTGGYIWHHKHGDEWGIRAAEELILLDSAEYLGKMFLYHRRNRLCSAL